MNMSAMAAVNIFMFYDPFGAKRYVAITDRHTKQDWAIQIIELLEVRSPTVEKIVSVVDNLNARIGSSLYEAFSIEYARRLLNQLEISDTSKDGSWHILPKLN
jgi:hypothetical protein